MASSAIYHARSISLPSRPHPVAEQLDERLSRLRSSQSTSTSSPSVSNGLNGLTDLYSSIDEFLQLPLNQQTLSQTHDSKWADQVLDGSLRLLDICSASRDALQESRESLKDVQSALRRRCSGELSITSEATEYLNTRRSVKKDIKKCLKNLKPATDLKDETHATVSLLKDVQAMTADTLKSLVSYISGSQKGGWSVVAKLINKNNSKQVATCSAFDDVDASLNSLICQKKSGISSSQIENLTSQILKLETEIQDVDEALESLFRYLVKTRATLLNIFPYQNAPETLEASEKNIALLLAMLRKTYNGI
ncbi:uncharacterized protein LOC141649853 [Silene latifolia]|uniref:uncharacterized protein LOC141649853 n=1 Tax=Silene latifolia TaxID=37657 RepID=UPI003D779CBA